MSKILFIKSSILGENSVSSKYGQQIVDKIKGDNEVIVKDLDKSPVMQLTSQTLAQLSNENNLITIQHEKLINELKEASSVIISAPMYNFNIPVGLKAYFDAISKVGKTFKYNEQGQAVGLIDNKPVYVVLSRGGMYKNHNLTFVEDYLKLQLNFIGLTNVKFIFVEGVAIGANLDEQFNNQI